MLRISMLGKSNLKVSAREGVVMMKKGVFVCGGIVLLALFLVVSRVAGEERPGFSLTTLETGDAFSTSIITGVHGLGIMSYIKGGDLKAGRCHNLACTEHHTTRLDFVGSGLPQTSIAIGG